MAKAYIGTSGFSYDDWMGVFYPEDLLRAKWLGYYSKNFSTVELNVTFYRLPKPKTFGKWRKETPKDFRFSLKGSRFITHIKRLLDPEEPVGRFMESAEPLRDKIAVTLWQLPPGFKADPERLKEFLSVLRPYGFRHAFEFRNETWLAKDVISNLQAEGAALCSADWPPFLDDIPVTADFVYIRRHGQGGSYATSYSDEELRRDARRIRKYLKGGKDVFIYFNNDAAGYAAQNALTLKKMLKAAEKRKMSC